MERIKRECTSCKISENARKQEEENTDEEDGDVQELNEGAVTTTEDEYSTSESEPDWESENVSMRHMSWWHARFKADKEEREGCPLAPDLSILLTEDPHKIYCQPEQQLDENIYGDVDEDSEE